MSESHPSVLLFEPVELRGIRANNRIVLSPMCQYSAPDGYASDWHLVHLGKCAQGGAGMVFAEATAVEARGRITHGDLGIWEDGQVAGLKRITDFIRSQGAVPALQLAHAGRKASMARPWFGNGPLTQADFDRGELPWEIIAASDVPVDAGWIVPRAATEADLEDLRRAYRSATQRALAAGFDIVEVHAAHGYLLHSFLSPVTNLRSDAYGGSLENRMRFPLEIARIVREEWPQDKPVFFRASTVDEVEHGWSLDDTVRLAFKLKEIGIDSLDCSSGGIAGSATAGRPALRRVPGFQLPFSERVRREAGILTMAVGLILTPRQAEDALQEGRADLIAIGREALFNPNWPLHAALELGVDREFALWPVQYGWWLARRESALRKEGIERRVIEYTRRDEQA